MSVKKTPGIVVGGERPRLFAFAVLRTSKGLGVALGVVVLLIAGLLIAYKMSNRAIVATPKPTIPTAGNSTSVKPVAVTYSQVNNDDLTTKVHYLVGSQQYAEAEKLIRTQDNYQSDGVKLGLLLSVQSAANDKTGASQTSGQLASLPDLSPAQYESLGNQYANSGDKTKALQYYNQAVVAYKARNVGADPDSVVRVEARIKELQ